MAESQRSQPGLGTVPEGQGQTPEIRIPSIELDLGGRFTDVMPLGYGSADMAYSAFDNQQKLHVSLRKISIEDRRPCQLALREVRILGKLRHENIISMLDVLESSGASLNSDMVDLDNLHTIYLIQDLMQVDLNQLIRSKQLTAGHVQVLSYQILRGLKYLHSANVLHRDLKPANIYVNCDTLLLKIANFGTMRILDPKYGHSGHLSSNVGSCWYRSPEALISPTDYSAARDVWSVGCIMAECCVGAPIFQGSHELDQLLRIIDCIHLTDQDWTQVLRIMPNKLLKNHPLRPRTPLRQKLEGLAIPALDLIDSLLTFDPKSRLSAAEALEHPYFSSINTCTQYTPVTDKPFSTEYEDDLSVSVLQNLLIRECKTASDEVRTDSPPPAISPVSTSSSRATTPSSTSGTPPRDDSMHTLDQIFQALMSPTAQGEQGDYVRHRNARNRRMSGDKKSIQMQNLRNIRPSHSMNIFQVNPRPVKTLKKAPSETLCEKTKHSEDEEKDVADCSATKIREDLELGLDELKLRTQVFTMQATQDVHISPNSQCQMLMVEIDQTENYKEYSQPSPKTISPNDTACGAMNNESNNIRGVSGAVGYPRNNDIDSNKEEFSKKQLKHEAAIRLSRKLILDKIETEKAQNEEQSGHHSTLTSEELDELYRLPTDHLSLNRDLSNNSLKNRQFRSTRGRRNMLTRRPQDRDRRKDEFFLEGACGGIELSPDHSDYSEPEDVLHSILSENAISMPPAPLTRTRSLYDMDINLDVLPSAIQEQENTVRDPLSSPESPPSPSNGRSGARPKKSPKKQRAL